jgi:hypothetical protein
MNIEPSFMWSLPGDEVYIEFSYCYNPFLPGDRRIEFQAMTYHENGSWQVHRRYEGRDVVAYLVDVFHYIFIVQRWCVEALAAVTVGRWL